MAKATYVHLANDGGIFVVRGATGQQGWVTLDILLAELDAAAEHSQSILVSMQQAKDRAPRIVAASLGVITASNLPVGYTSQIHPSAVQRDGITTLMKAAISGREDLVRDLVNRRADTSATDIAGYTALMCAAYAGKLGSVKLLVAAGADLNARDLEGCTPLMFAAQNGHREVVEYLVGAGADLNLRGKGGFRAVDIANQNKHAEIVSFLSQRGSHLG